MRVEILPSVAKGIIQAPPSKSMAHRLIICAALADGASTIHNVDMSEDIGATLDCLKALGLEYTYESGSVIIDKPISYRELTNVTSDSSELTLNCRESGSTLRFLVPLAMSIGRGVTLAGKGRLMERPMTVYEDIAIKQGIEFTRGEGTIHIGSDSADDCPKRTDDSCNQVYRVRGDISSQFITGLILQYLFVRKDGFIEIIPPVESLPYIHMTLQAITMFGGNVHMDGNTITVNGTTHLTGGEKTVEGDYSNAAFLDAFNCIGGLVQVTGCDEDSLQGDKIYREYYRKLCDTSVTEDETYDISACPDLGPILFTMAAMNHGGTFTGTKRLRIKESDRAAVMQEELSKFGAQLEVLDNTVKVKATKLHAPEEILSAHNDHRIAMSMAIAASVYGGVIDEAESVRKSYPGFFKDIESLGIKCEGHI